MFVYFVLIFQQILSSGTHIIAKIVVRDIDPVSLTMMRSIMAATFLLAYLGVSKKRIHFDRSDFKLVIWLSILAIPINQFLFLEGMRYSTPANAALLYGTTPALVLLFSYFLGTEKITRRKGLGVAIAFIGVVAIIFEHGIEFHSKYAFGNLLFLLAVLAWGLYTVQGRTLTLKYGAFTTTATTMILGTAFFIPIGIVNLVHYDFSSLTLADWGGLLYLALGTSIISYYLWYYALQRMEASKAGIFTNLQPLLTTLLAVVLLGLHLTPLFMVGGFFALVGVVIVQ